MLKGLNNWLEIALDKLQGELKMSLEREESLKRTIENAKAKNMSEIEELQHREMEKKHHIESKLTI